MRIFNEFRQVASAHVTKREIRLKSGVEIPKGVSATVKFLGRHQPNGTTICMVSFGWTDPDTDQNYQKEPLRVRISRLPEILTGFRVPSVSQMARMGDDGIATTPTGKRVEPDGWGPDGSPSWLLVLGMI